MSKSCKSMVVKIKEFFIKSKPADEREKIAKRAYELYEQRGRQGGHETEDWLQAEREIHKKKSRKG